MLYNNNQFVKLKTPRIKKTQNTSHQKTEESRNLKDERKEDNKRGKWRREKIQT